MSAAYIVALIIALIGAVICYLFITQTLEKKRKQRLRLITALSQRAKVFRYILSGFPPNFLTKELTLLVQRCLTDVLKQLAALEPKNKGHVEELTLVAGQIQATQQQQGQAKRPVLQSAQQVKDVKAHLQELYKFLTHLHRRGAIKKVEADDFGEQIKQLVLQISVDGYIVQGRQARQAGKPRLAIHFFGLADKLIEKDTTGRFAGQQVKLKQIIAQLEATVGEQPDKPTEEAPPQDKEWADITQQNSWKKKNLYDE